MSKKPLFSLVVPVYNIEAYIKQCVDSILKQTYENIEIVLVDDGSPDNCPTICDEYAARDSRVKVVHKENGGLVSARKAGANIACGDYVVCVDGDDWIGEGYIAKFAEIAAAHDPDVIVCGVVEASENHSFDRPLAYRSGYYSRENIVNEIFPTLIQDADAKYFPPSVWAKAFRASLYLPQQNAVDDRLKIGEDRGCTIPCIYRASSMYITTEVAYYYRQNPSSMTKNKRAFPWSGPGLLYKLFCQEIDLDVCGFKAQVSREVAHELFLVAVSQFHRRGSYRSIARDVKSNLKDPVYAECVKKAKFRSFKGKLAVWAMKYRLCFLMRIFARLKSA